MISIQHRQASLFRFKRLVRPAVKALAMSGMILVIGATASASEDCAGPGRQAAVLAAVDGWRSLTTTAGLRVTPAGIADFSALSGNAENPADEEAMRAKLNEAFSALLGTPLRITIVSPEADRHGRQPALLFSGKGLVQADLVADGVAFAYPTGAYLPCADRLFAAERLARIDKAGFWALSNDWIASPRPDEFSRRMSRFTILEGRVVSVGTRKSRTYLNFGGRWASDVTVEIPAGRRDLLGGAAALESLAGRPIRVRGFPIEKSGPMLEVRHPWQIEQIR